MRMPELSSAEYLCGKRRVPIAVRAAWLSLRLRADLVSKTEYFGAQERRERRKLNQRLALPHWAISSPLFLARSQGYSPLLAPLSTVQKQKPGVPAPGFVVLSTTPTKE